MAYASDFVGLLLKQVGDTYQFGAVAADSDPDPTRFDCAELVRWACRRLNVVPTCPDGSWMQVRHCRDHGMLIAVPEAMQTQGALLFRFRGDPFLGGRPTEAHVAVSLGNRSTIEARGKAWGVGSWSVAGRGWTHGGLVPGINYRQPPAPPPAPRAIEIVPPWPGRFLTQPPVMGGTDVRRWQAQLAAIGWPIRVDGRYGPESQSHCRQFQRESGLQVDGIVGAQTWRLSWTAARRPYPARRG